MTAYASPLLRQNHLLGSLGRFGKGWGTHFGFGLFDTLLSLGLVIVLTAGAYALFAPTSTASAVSLETSRLSALLQSIDASHGTAMGFADLEQAPPAVPGYQSNTSSWGQPFSVLPTQVTAPGDAWMATYQGVQPDVCIQLGVQQINQGQWYGVEVDQKVVGNADALRAACTLPTDGDVHELQFIQYTGPRYQGVNRTDCLIPLNGWCGTLRNTD